jgi:hypothetical protein
LTKTRRDYSQESLQKFSHYYESASKDVDLNYASPVNQNNRPSKLKIMLELFVFAFNKSLRIKYRSENNFKIDRNHLFAFNYSQNYYSNRNAYKSPPSQQNLRHHHHKENSPILIEQHPSPSHPRYDRKYKVPRTHVQNPRTITQEPKSNRSKKSLMHTAKSSTSWNPDETSMADGTFVDEGFTEMMHEANRATEKRLTRSISETKTAKTTASGRMGKEHKTLLYPVIKILMEQVKIWREIEHQRLALSHTKDFNLADLFKIFSINKNDTLAKHEFTKGCELFGIKTKRKENLLNVFDRYATDIKLNFQQFSEIFLPHDPQHSKEISNRIPKYGKSFPKDKVTVFKEQTRQQIVKLIAVLVKAELQLKLLQRDAHAKCNNIHKCFRLLSKQGTYFKIPS